MKHCPTCREEYEDELSFCTFDGAQLFPPGLDANEESTSEVMEGGHHGNPWKVAFFLLLCAALTGGATAAYILRKKAPEAAASQTGKPNSARVSQVTAAAPREFERAQVDVTQLSRAELLNLVPKNLLTRFHTGEDGRPAPDEFRVLEHQDGDYVAMVGTSKSGPARLPNDQVLIVRYIDDQLRDVTRECLPSYGGGALGQNIHANFDTTGSNLVIRRPASSRAIVDECSQCEHAYQRVTLEWNGSRYVEKRREWDDTDRYTAFYVLAEALAKRKVDPLARPLIDQQLDATISQGFERADRKGWVVENLTEDGQATAADYELKNGSDRLVIRVSKTDGKWMATRIIAR